MKIPIVKQHDLTDCAPACLSSLIKYYGGYVPIEVIRLKCETNKDGTSAYNLIEAAKKLGLSAKGVKVSSFKKLYGFKTPYIIHLKLKNGLNHFVILYKIDKRFAYLMDPAQGKIKIKLDEFESVFTNVILLFQPKSNLANYDKPINVITFMFNYFVKYKNISINLFIVSLFSVIICLVLNFTFKWGSNISNGGFGLTTIIYFSIIILTVYVMKNILNYVKNTLIIIFNKQMSADLYEKFQHQLFILPLNFIKSKTSGEIVSRYSELNEINHSMPSMIISLVLDLIMIVCSFVTALFISLKLSMLYLLLVIIYIFISFLFKNPTLQMINKNIDIYSKFNTDVIDNVNSIISTKFLNNEENMERRLERSTVNYLYDSLNIDNYFNKLELLKNTLMDTGKWMITAFGFYLVFKNKLSIINLFTFELIVNYFLDPIKEIIEIIPKYAYIKSSFYKLSEFSLIKEENKGIYDFKNGDIKVNNLSFSYDSTNFLFKNLSFFIKEKDRVLLQGKSGSGKSTLCQIISKQLNPSEGNIKIGDTNLDDFNINSFRKNVTYIGQKDSLIVDTLINNIKYERNISDKEIKKVCDICEIDEIINNKFDRYNMFLNESSANISGGEKQRIILARGLINSGNILILDEALSEVNKDMEYRILEKIFKYFSDKTIIYVSHKEYKNLFKTRISLT